MSREPEILKSIIDDTEYNKTPQSRNEEILLSILNDTEYTKTPQSREEELLLELKDKIGHGITVEPLSVTENGTYTAPAGTAYNPVEVTITPPQIIKRVTGNPVEFSDGADAPVVKCVTQITGSQDLHGQDKPWVGGAGKNKYGGDSSVTLSGVGRIIPNLYPITLPTGTYTASFEFSGTLAGQCQFVIYDSNQQGIETRTQNLVNGRNTLTLTIDEDGYYVTLYSSNSNGGVYSNIQIESGSTATSYAPYSNICPITAYTENTISVGGKNLLPATVTRIKAINTGVTWDGNSCVKNNITWTILTDDGTTVKGIKANGTANADSVLIINSGIGMFTYNEDTSILSGTPANPSQYYIRFGATNPGISYDDGGQGITIPKIDDAKTRYTYVQCAVKSGVNVNNIIFYPMIRPSSVTDNSYEIYKKIDHTTTYPSAIYRGNEDCVNGEVECVQKKLTISSNVQMIAIYGDDNAPLFYVTVDSNDVAAYCINTDPIENKLISNFYTANTMSTADGMKDFEMRTNYISSQNHNNIYWRDSRFTSATDMNTYIASNPIEIVYRVYPSPTTSPVTPTNLPLKTLFGYNHIESSTGEMVLDYITDKYQNFVNTVNRAVPNTRKSGSAAMEVFMSLEKYEEPEQPEQDPEDVKGETR